jgi:hypothetical protein
MAIADTLPKSEQAIEGSKPILEGIYAMFQKLANYEDTGLSPEQVNELIRAIARNLVAWDTSKDKSQGLLPEVYLTNQCLYKKLTGVEYSFIDACKRFNIGD